jgi:uncharacterized membrane protein YciS (DUF1049 family)
MSNSYVAASFAVTAVILGWDYLLPRLKLQRIRRTIRLRARRESARKQA